MNRDKTNTELLWDLLWGPASEKMLAQDDGKRTPSPTDPNEEFGFHVNNLIAMDIGDVAEAVRFLRQHIDDSSPKAAIESIRELLRRFNLSAQHLHKALGAAPSPRIE